MIFREPVTWSGIWRFGLLACLFFGAILALRYVTIVSTGQGTIAEFDLLGAAAFALFFTRMVARSKSAVGRRIIVGAVLLGPPLVVLVKLTVSAVWEAGVRLFGGGG